MTLSSFSRSNQPVTILCKICNKQVSFRDTNSRPFFLFHEDILKAFHFRNLLVMKPSDTTREIRKGHGDGIPRSLVLPKSTA